MALERAESAAALAAPRPRGRRGCRFTTTPIVPDLGILRQVGEAVAFRDSVELNVARVARFRATPAVGSWSGQLRFRPETVTDPAAGPSRTPRS